MITVQRVEISHAARILNLPEPILRHLVAAEVIEGDKSVCDLQQASQIAARLRDAQASVEGQGILAKDVLAKYGFSDQSIYKWHADGWVKSISDKSRNRLFNEGDIALAHELANLVGHIPGRAVFPAKPRTGRPKKKIAA